MEQPPGRLGATPAAGQHEANPDGHIPFAIRVGVTGHRRIAVTTALTIAVADALERISALAPSAPGVPPIMVVISSLAEGADRLVAKQVLAIERNRLEVALPLAPDDYMEDFKSEGSRREFHELLRDAGDVWQAPFDEDRDAAYESAGRHVVDRCDALIALWDGEASRGRGGTADTVAYARRRERPLLWIRPTSPPVLSDELGSAATAVITDAALDLRRFNGGTVPRDRIRATVAAETRALGLVPDAAGTAELDGMAAAATRTAAQLLPCFARADLLAQAYQRRFHLASAAVFAAAAAAVIVGTLQWNFFRDLQWILAFELGLLVLLLAIPFLSRRLRLHERWISYRFLAERLRSAYFLSLAGTSDRARRSSRPAYLSDSGDLWIARALEGATAHVAHTSLRPSDVRSLRAYLGTVWIEGQLDYHAKASRVHRERDEWLFIGTAGLFALTLVVTLVHIVLHDIPDLVERVLIMVSVCVPVIGAAVHGFGTTRQFRRNADRYARMAVLLRTLKEEMDRARSLETVRRIAADAEHVMREENSDWFGVMRFFDVELIT